MFELKKIRESSGKTQAGVSLLSGITRSYYTNIESGKRRPSPEVAQKIAEVLGFDWTKFYTVQEHVQEEKPQEKEGER